MEEELARILREKYDSAKCKEISLQVHLFGIEYGEVIKEKGYKVSKIVEMAGLEKGYIPEVSKGVKLSSYVVPR
jgi:hypothetical protein